MRVLQGDILRAPRSAVSGLPSMRKPNRSIPIWTNPRYALNVAASENHSERSPINDGNLISFQKAARGRSAGVYLMKGPVRSAEAGKVTYGATKPPAISRWVCQALNSPVDTLKRSNCVSYRGIVIMCSTRFEVSWDGLKKHHDNGRRNRATARRS